MKIAKKTAAFLLVLFLGIQCMPLTALAADGTLSFSDPTAKAGETIEVTVKINTAEGPIGDGQVQVTYDPTYLEFVSGVNATGEAGTITLSASGNGTDSELAYSMTFKALAEGETTLQAVGYTAYTFGGEELNLTLGTSAVKIEAGDGTQPAAAQQPGTQTMIELDGKQYFIADDIPEALIPEGYEKSQLTYEGSPHTILVHTGSGQKMIYLMDTQGEGNLFLYDSETDHFSAFEKIDLSSDSYILITDDKESANIPEDYEETTIQINGKVFPAWQNVVDTKLADFCLVYAVDNAGKKGLYQYDSTQKTYQRFLPPTAELAAAAAGMLGIRAVGTTSDEGTLDLLGKCRGRKRAVDFLQEEMERLGYTGGCVRIGHCRNTDSAGELRTAILHRFPGANIRIYPLRGLCSYYAECGGVLVGFEA